MNNDSRSYTLATFGREISLTNGELRLLKILNQEPGRTFTRPELLAALTAGEAIILERTVDVHICALRRKLGKNATIETVRGHGYRLISGPIQVEPTSVFSPLVDKPSLS